MRQVPSLLQRGDVLNSARILQERIHDAFAPVRQPDLSEADPDELARASSDTCRDLDLAQRVAAIRSIVRGRVVFTTSFGIEDQAIAHAIFTQALLIDVVTLDTGRLFPETYELWARTERRYRRRIRGFFPDRVNVEGLLIRQGINGFYRSIEARRACCAMRKLEPLQRAIAGATAWITGLRADQSEERAGISFAAVEPHYRLIKVNPLFDWTRERVLSFIREYGIPYNSLHDEGFLSIGCAPCTRAVKPGESERAGRWWWEEERRKECGLHGPHPPQVPGPGPGQSEMSAEDEGP
jgi:phosphoadenosine phosphosulfate reductase